MAVEGTTRVTEAAGMRLFIHGAVQGVGFRPFLHRLARQLRLTGWVRNSPQGVNVEAEGCRADLETFLVRVEKEKPPLSRIERIESSFYEPAGYHGFEIRESDESGEMSALILPDIATCPECLAEVLDEKNRRFFYPFTNCTHCGPRFTIIEALPYDRRNTSMKGFDLCEQCQAEYENPDDRRFHAQPNACPACGPRMEFRDNSGKLLQSHRAAILAAVDALRQGAIVAVKGLGGFHLMVIARCERAVRRLRLLKCREEKPFAMMFPALEQVRAACDVSETEEVLLRSPEAPIVLLDRMPACREQPAAQTGIALSVAPGNPRLGVMLPHTPLHHLLLLSLGAPVVATSGNLADEPICIDEHEAFERLGGVADLFLTHNRPIVRHTDDSIVRVLLGEPQVLRRGRGFAPLPVQLNEAGPSVLAVGAQQKNCVAVGLGRQVFVSQHVGDLDSESAFAVFRRTANDLPMLYEAKPEAIVADLHPDYLSSQYAEDSGLPVIRVQHHHAHVLSCMVENRLEGPVLGIVWDGTGYGPDGTVWGGEFLRVDEDGFQRLAHWRTFRLPGGEKASREPRRSAIGLLYAMLGAAALERENLHPVRSFSKPNRDLLGKMLAKGVQSPVTSSARRLFDAMASLMGLRQSAGFEGQAAMDLEFAMDNFETDEAYAVHLSGDVTQSNPVVLDWEPLFEALISDLERALPASIISARFHNALVEAIVEVAQVAGEERVLLTGGCFQNKYLSERAAARLSAEGFRPIWHRLIPPNDGGIALGQALAGMVVLRSRQRPKTNC